MKFFIDGLEVIFPYEYIYPEQYAYMVELKKTLDVKGHGLLEMPSGTGKTVTLLSFIVSYQKAHPNRNRLVYCSRTVPEIDKALHELRHVMAYRERLEGKQSAFLGLGLTSRKNLCLNPEVNQQGLDGKQVDAKCHERTASWIRQRARSDGSIPSCDFFEHLERKDEPLIPFGVYTLDDLREYGREHTLCPYFLARRMLSSANVIIYSYYYLLDPKVAELVSKELSKDCIVVFDEAHNIDNVCIESFSIDLNRHHLDASSRSLQTLSERIEE